MISADAYLRMADDVAAMTSNVSRAWLLGTANTMRWMKGAVPVEAPVKGAHAHAVVAGKDAVRLLKYDARGEQRHGPVLIIPSLINQWYVFDLLPDVSVIHHLTGQGFDVFVVDWGAPGPEGRDRSFADYADNYIPWAVDQASGGTGAVHVLGYCMGGTLTAIHAALHPEQVKTLTLLGAPIDFRQSGLLATWTERRYFDADLLVDAFGNVPPFMLQSAFKAMAATATVKKYSDLWERAEDADAVRYFLAVESWLEDNVAFPGGLYRPYIKDCYQENKLIQNTMVVGGRTVDLRNLTMPVATVVALRDQIVAPPGARAVLDAAASRDKQLFEYDTGHIGLTTSKRTIRELWPQVSAWLAQRS